MCLTYFILPILMLFYDMDDLLATCLLSFAACLQVFTRDSSSGSISKDAGISLNTSMKLPLAFASKPDENGILPNQPPPEHLLASSVSAEVTMNRQLVWELAKQSEAHPDRLIVLGEWANAQRELANILCRESVLAVNQLAATVGGAIVPCDN